MVSRSQKQFFLLKNIFRFADERTWLPSHFLLTSKAHTNCIYFVIWTWNPQFSVSLGVFFQQIKTENVLKASIRNIFFRCTRPQSLLNIIKWSYCYQAPAQTKQKFQNQYTVSYHYTEHKIGFSQVYLNTLVVHK